MLQSCFIPLNDFLLDRQIPGVLMWPKSPYMVWPLPSSPHWSLVHLSRLFLSQCHQSSLIFSKGPSFLSPQDLDWCLFFILLAPCTNYKSLLMIHYLTPVSKPKRRLLRVPWTARSQLTPCQLNAKQSILKEIHPEYSLEGLMLKLKL